MKRRYAGFLLFLFLSAPLLAVSAGEPAIRMYVASHAYVVSISPVDEESRNAESSILYQRQIGDKEWLELGECAKHTLAGGEIRFTRTVEVKEDGLYQYTSRPVVGGRVTAAPTVESIPQAVVIVDIQPPVAILLQPEGGKSVSPGERIALSWKAEDDNLGPLPVALAFTTDGGTSWNRIGGSLAAEGVLPWTAPADLDGPIVIRLTAADLAGNASRDIRDLALAEPPPLPVVAPELPPPLPTPPVQAVRDVPPTAPAAEPEPEPARVAKRDDYRETNRSWLYYLMAINLMRQNKPADALQYYWLSVKEDPDFIDAWADIGLAYIDLGAYKTARDVVERTRDKAPERIDLMHLLGETYHAEGMALLGTAKTPEQRREAKGLIDQAVAWYGRALDKAAGEWRLAEQAASFYRLGEVCYYVNFDRDGARAYWKKILELHSPTPNADLVLWTPEARRGKAKERYRRYTYMRVSLEAWQNWARGYLEQMDERERAGILDLMPAQRIAAIPAPQPLAYGNSVMNPGRDDGRSLFSLPAQLGIPAPVAACAAESAGTVVESVTPVRPPSPPAADYSFYAPKGGFETGYRDEGTGRSPGRRPLFTGGLDDPPPANPDPYLFPAGGRPQAAWNGYGPYGAEPIQGW